MGRHSFRYIQQIKQRRSLPWRVPSFSLHTISFKCPTQTVSVSRFINPGADYSFFVTWVIHKLCKLSMSHSELRNSCPKFTLPFEFPSLVNQLNIQTINLLDLSRNLDVTLLFPSLLIFIHPVGLCPMHFSLTLCRYHFPPLLPCVVSDLPCLGCVTAAASQPLISLFFGCSQTPDVNSKVCKLRRVSWLKRFHRLASLPSYTAAPLHGRDVHVLLCLESLPRPPLGAPTHQDVPLSHQTCFFSKMSSSSQSHKPSAFSSVSLILVTCEKHCPAKLEMETSTC